MPLEKAWQVGLARPARRETGPLCPGRVNQSLTGLPLSCTRPSTAVLWDRLACLQIKRIRCPGHQLRFPWPQAHLLRPWLRPRGWNQSQRVLPSFSGILLWEKG